MLWRGVLWFELDKVTELAMRNKGGVFWQRGFYLVLCGFLAVVLLSFAALVVGLGYLSTDKTRLQNAANLAALGALEAYVRSDVTAAHAARCQTAAVRANQILGENRLPGVKRELGEVAHVCGGGTGGAGGALALGAWVKEPPQDPTRPSCPATYPCFVANDAFINAARLQVRTQAGNELIIGLTRILGRDAFAIRATATAVIVPRCLVLALDASGSTTYETHFSDYIPLGAERSSPNAADSIDLNRPPAPGRYGVFAFSADTVSINCPVKTNKPDQLLFCAMGAVRGTDTNPRNHYRSDYQDGNGNWRTYTVQFPQPIGDQTLVVDGYMNEANRYYGAEPLSRYFLSFNVALRRLLQSVSGEDRAMLLVFRNRVNANDIAPAGGLNRQFTELINLTDVRRRVTDPAGDNFVTRGWLPAPGVGEGGTNIVGALKVAVSELGNRARCPAEAQKIIILATDGIMTCSEQDLNLAAA